MYRMIMLTWSETCSTLASPSTLPVFDLLPREYHDSMPGRMALKPLRRSRLTCGSDSHERLLSAMKSIEPGSRRFDRVQHLVEADAEVGIVPADARPAQLLAQEREIVLQHLHVERLIRHDRVDAEAAGVRAAEAAEHRHDLEERGFAQRRLDELPALAHPGECHRLARRRAVHAEWPVPGAILEDVSDDRPVREPEHVIEIAAGVFGVAARVRAAQHGDRPGPAEQIAERVGEQSRFGERTDEDEVDVGGELGDEVLEAGVADEGDLVAFGLAPHADDLRHDARQIGVHHPRVQRARRPFGYEVDDADAQLTHTPDGCG